MTPAATFCPNPDCPARGQRDKGNIGIHSQKERRSRCRVCEKTFSARKGTPFYRLRNAEALVTQVITLLAHGCPVQAIVAAFDLDERTVSAWQQRAGAQAEAVHEHLVEQGRELDEVQCDELRVKAQGQVWWMAMAVMVSSRLWLGGEVGTSRDYGLIKRMIERVKRCALCRPPLFCTDGLSSYVTAIREVFRAPDQTGERGRPSFVSWPGIYLAQVVKQYIGKRVAAVSRRIIQGTAEQLEAVRHKVKGGGVLNTAFIERLNLTFRAHLAPLHRRTRALGRVPERLERAMYLVGAVYNFCSEHRSLRLPGLIGGHKWLGRTPAMAAGITDHQWAVGELLSFRVPVQQSEPPEKRGRRSQATLQLIEQWCS